MKSSNKGPRQRRSTKCLIVDGYNILAKWQRSSLREIHDLDAARDALINHLAEYGAYSGEHVIVVFDAHKTDAMAIEETRHGVRVVFTMAQETADDRIERLVYELEDIYREITVATSDLAEQQVVFGKGALRISASELVRRMRDAQRQIECRAADASDKRPVQVLDTLRQDIANILEKWRRQ